MPVEGPSPVGQRINVWRVDIVGPKTLQFGAEVVDADQENIEPLVARGKGSDRQKSEEAEERKRSEFQVGVKTRSIHGIWRIISFQEQRHKVFQDRLQRSSNLTLVVGGGHGNNI